MQTGATISSHPPHIRSSDTQGWLIQKSNYLNQQSKEIIFLWFKFNKTFT